jgi:anti-anti-sigma factor
VLDLSDLAFLDSTGLRLMITADARAREEGRQLAVVRPNDMIRRVLRLTRLDERLNIVEDAGTADAR